MISEALDIRLPLFVTRSEAIQAAGWAFLPRVSARRVDRDPESGDAITDPQAIASIAWCANKDPDNSFLGRINRPGLVVCGSDDTMLPDRNAYFIFKHASNAQLELYLDSGHGAPFQYPERFVNHVTLFLTE